MQLFTAGAGRFHQAPFPDGPNVEVLLDDDADGRRLSAAHVMIAPGAAMPDHDHGESEALIVPLAGELVISDDKQKLEIRAGVVVHLDRGERVRVDNHSEHPASLIAVFAPAAFIGAFADWPTI